MELKNGQELAVLLGHQMLKLINFMRFRGFERLNAEMMPNAYIVGPNSAGKSTVIEAIVLAEQCIRIARRRKPTTTVKHKGFEWRAHNLPTGIDNSEDPVRHNFGTDETSVTVRWADNSELNIIWPKEIDNEEERGKFYFVDSRGGNCVETKAIERQFSSINIVPVITPLERNEELKDQAYVELNSNTRLASRHFRNHAWQMQKSGQWELFKDFCSIWLPEIEIQDVQFSFSANRLAVFYAETGSRIPKELAWAGDGIQIWVQILWHLFRAKDAKTIVLDEPEVYLHPDLQRRLVRLLDSLSCQIILASHSADVISEAPPDSILWVDRRQNAARRVRTQKSLSNLSASLGSSYNLALARSMRACLVVASDCKDLRVIRSLSKQLGATRLANEQIVTLVQLQNVQNWMRIDDLGETLREALPARLPTAILLQSQFRTKDQNARLAKNLAAETVKVFFIRRPELENYLLDEDTISRVSGAAPEAIYDFLTEMCVYLRSHTRKEFISTWAVSAAEGQEGSQLAKADVEFERMWSDEKSRLFLTPGTLILRELNIWLESGGYRTVSANALARSIRPQDLDSEIVSLLFSIDDMATQHWQNEFQDTDD